VTFKEFKQETIVKTTTGKVVRIGSQKRFFPALERSPRGAYDSAPEREDDEAHDAALEHVRGCSDERAAEIQDALDRRAGAAARDRRARDGEEADRDMAYRISRDGERDHRSDFEPIAAGGPDKASRDAFARAADQIRGRAHDARRGVAMDAKARALTDVDVIFGAGGHPQRNHGA
jgi:hypothetical protein